MSFLASDSVAPFFRFIMELSTWIWLAIIFFLTGSNFVLVLLLVSVLGLGLLNYPGDKKPADEGVTGIAIPGKLRVILEVLTAMFGLYGALLLLSIVGGVLQLLITIFYLRFDSDRLSWMWGWQTYPPEYVTNLHKLRDKYQDKEVKPKSKRKHRK